MPRNVPGIPTIVLKLLHVRSLLPGNKHIMPVLQFTTGAHTPVVALPHSFQLLQKLNSVLAQVGGSKKHPNNENQDIPSPRTTQLVLTHSYGANERNPTLTYSTSTPYTKMKPVRAALTFFAAKLVDKSDVDQMRICENFTVDCWTDCPCPVCPIKVPFG